VNQPHPAPFMASLCALGRRLLRKPAR
jgi:hypothetical protein